MRENLTRLVILLSFVILTGCVTTNCVTDLPCPVYPELNVIDEELAAATPKIVRELTQENYVLIDEYVKKLESRLECEM